MRIEFVDSVYGIDLSEEHGYWDEYGIYIYRKLPLVYKIGVLIHEFIERILELHFGFSHCFSHRIANIVEYILTLGQSEIYWGCEYED